MGLRACHGGPCSGHGWVVHGGAWGARSYGGARSGSGPRVVHAVHGAWLRARCTAGSARKQALNPRPLVHPFARSMAWRPSQAAGHDAAAMREPCTHANGAGNAACTPLSRPHR
jgi:hypothetical protein